MKKILFMLFSFFLLYTLASASDFCCEKDVVLVSGKTVPIDCDIAVLVQALNDAGIRTLSSCDGHGKTDGYILTDEYLIIIAKERWIKAKKRYEREWNPTVAVGNWEKRQVECKD